MGAVAVQGANDLVEGKILGIVSEQAENIEQTQAERLQVLQTIASRLRDNIPEIIPVNAQELLDQGFATKEELNQLAGRPLASDEERRRLGRFEGHQHQKQMFTRPHPKDWLRRTASANEWYRYWSIPLQEGWVAIVHPHNLEVIATYLPDEVAPSVNQLKGSAHLHKRPEQPPVEADQGEAF